MAALLEDGHKPPVAGPPPCRVADYDYLLLSLPASDGKSSLAGRNAGARALARMANAGAWDGWRPHLAAGRGRPLVGSAVFRPRTCVEGGVWHLSATRRAAQPQVKLIY